MDQTKFCQNCGAPMKYSQRLGRLYCSALCWQNKPQKPQTFQKAVPQAKPSPLSEILNKILAELKKINEWMRILETKSVIYPSEEESVKREIPRGEPPQEETEEFKEETEEEL